MRHLHAVQLWGRDMKGNKMRFLVLIKKNKKYTIWTAFKSPNKWLGESRRGVKKHILYTLKTE
jgi:hypothetical protein